MSSYFKQFAKRKDFLNILKEMQRRIAKSERVANPLEVVEFKHYLRSNNDRLLWFTQATNTTNAVVTDPNLKYYRLPYEPDGNKLRVWFRFNDFTGGTVKDWSGLGNTGTVVGSPTKQEGHVESMNALAFNGIDNQHVRVPHKVPDTSIALNSMPTGFSIGVWVRPNRIDLHGGKPRVIACKVDDTFASQNRGWSLWVEQDGTVYFVVRFEGITYVRRATNAIPSMNHWYFIAVSYNVPAGLIPPIRVNATEYTNDAQTLNDKNPYFTTSATTGIDMVIGGTGESGASSWAGSISDFRYFYERIYSSAEGAIQYVNKYTISDIPHVALAGVATTAFEEIGSTPPPVGGTPDPPPPPPSATGSFSPVSFSPYSFNISTAESQPGEGGGGGDTTPSIPDQFFDDFAFSPRYTLTSLNQISPDSKWKLNVISGTNGYVRTEDYTAPGDSLSRSVLRMKSGSTSVTHPVLTLNTARFYDLYFQCLLRTVSQTTTGTTNAPWIVFKYVDANNYYYVVLTTTGVQLARVISGTTTTLATQSNPGGNIIYPIGSLHDVRVETRIDGVLIRVYVDDTTNAKISYDQASWNPPDNTITSLATAGFRAVNSDFVTDNVLIRPVFGDSFQMDNAYTINTTGAKSPNGKWETITTAGGTGGTIRTYDHSSFANGGRVLNLNSGTGGGATPAPVVLSTSQWGGVDARVAVNTLSQHVVDEVNRAEFIFKWKDANNYYWMQLLPTGWKVKRRVGGVVETIHSATTPTFADNTVYPFYVIRILVYNSGKDIEIFTTGTTTTPFYEEHSKSDGWYTDDGGLISGLGRIGFKAPNCNMVADNIYVKRI